MKSWDQFRLDAYWAYNAIAEAEGFKSGAEKRQKRREALKKARRKDALTAKEKREKKVQDLASNPKSWRNLQ
tara:strand:- start:465 stop:680 length:216 start_codon:yes stop_codon:yes gene_type:complete